MVHHTYGGGQNNTSFGSQFSFSTFTCYPELELRFSGSVEHFNPLSQLAGPELRFFNTPCKKGQTLLRCVWV